MHSYINNNELLILHGKGRKALIRPNVTTRDLDEYINTLAICFNNSGINVSMFNMPKIFKNKAKNIYTVAFVIRDSIKIEDNNFGSLLTTAKSIDNNIISLGEYIERVRKNK